MNVICVDDEKIALESIRRKLERIDFVTQIDTFQSPNKVLSYLEEHDAEVVLLDINMQSMNGLLLAKKIKEVQPKIVVIFATGYSDYAVQAFKVHARGYLMKPIDEEELREELQYLLLGKVEDEELEHKKVRIQCFGDFEVFIDNEPVHFNRSRTKELLAYLVDRVGASCNTSTLCDILWEEEVITPSMKSQVRNCIAELFHLFEEAGVENVLFKNRNSYAINTEEVECDYYGFRRREHKAISLYFGEYMSQYSWAEMTLGGIETERSREEGINRLSTF